MSDLQEYLQERITEKVEYLGILTTEIENLKTAKQIIDAVETAHLDRYTEDDLEKDLEKILGKWLGG